MIPRKAKKGFIFLVENKEAFTVAFSLNCSARFETLKAATHHKLRFVDFFPLPKSFELQFHREFNLYHLSNNWYSIEVRKQAIEYIKAEVLKIQDAEDNLEPPKLTGFNRMVYIAAHIDIKALIDSVDNLHRNSPELQKIVEFGLNPDHVAKLGFTVPITTAGPDKGKPDPIRYLGRLLDVYDRKLELADQTKIDGARFNYYRITK